MRLVIFGLTISSSWGNGHATLWRGLCRALTRRGHHVTFFERDVPYYEEHRDLTDLPGGRLVFYGDWPLAREAMADEDLLRIALAARERTLEEHTAARRALDLEAALETAPQLLTEVS